MCTHISVLENETVNCKIAKWSPAYLAPLYKWRREGMRFVVVIKLENSQESLQALLMQSHAHHLGTWTTNKWSYAEF